MVCVSNRERQKEADCRGGKAQLLSTPRLCLDRPPPLQERTLQALLWPCLLGVASFPQLLGLESLIWESRICFPFGPYERGQKQRAILVSGQEVFAQPYGQML